MFLFISGYLYGHKEIPDTLDYVCKQFKKILLPYHTLVVIAITVGVIFARDDCNLKAIFGLLFLYGHGNYSGVAHLWFIPYILMCYLITPFPTSNN